MSFLGIDIGTSGCKAAVFDLEGNQIAFAYREYDVIFTGDGGVELKSDEVIANCFEVIKDCTSQIPKNSVEALGISSQGEAFTAVDKDTKSIFNAMVSSDTRSSAYVKSWTARFGENKLYQITGHTAHPMFTLFKLLWLKDNKRDIWNKAEKFLCFEDLLQYRLGLEPTIGWPLAGRTMMFDVRSHKWSIEILDALGMKEDQLARPLQSGSIAGQINSSIAKELGLAENVRVVSGGHDQVCNALGAGIVKPGKAMYASGTVECITPCFEKPIFDDRLKQNNLCTYDHALKGKYTTVAFSLTGGNILKWFRDEFARLEINEARITGKDVYELILNDMWEKPSGLMVLPYFTPTGTPYFDTETKGAVFGLRISTKRDEFIRALLEAVTFETRLNLELIEKSGYQIDELSIVGGSAKSRKWSQLKADVTGKIINILKSTEAGCMGAAMLACSSLSGISAYELAEKWVSVESVLEPNLEFHHHYNNKFKNYKKLHNSVRKISI
jgi:xylulokinase